MRFGLLVRGLVASSCLAGCALIAGLSDEGSGGAPLEAGLPDRAATDAARVDGAACTSSVLEESKTFAFVRGDVTVDAKDADWKCVDSLTFKAGQRAFDVVAGKGSALVAGQWNEDNLFFYARVVTSAPGASAALDQNNTNDGFHVYVMGPSPTDAYDGRDHHIVVDHLGQVADYGDGSTYRPVLDGIEAKATTARTENGDIAWDVELRVSAKSIGRTKLTTTDKVRVNFQINDAQVAADGGTKLGYRVMYLDSASCPVAPGCNQQGTSEPFCNPLCTREVKLQ